MEDRQRIEKALDIADGNGQIDGDHHKAWVIDQMVRALTGCPMETRTAVDCHGTPYTYEAQGESDEYRQFIEDHNHGEDGADTYSWDEGITP